MKRLVSIAALVVALPACGGAGKYSYSRTYVNAGDEADFARRANNEAVYDEVRRMPDRYNNQVISWFGVVSGVDRAPDGASRVAMQVHTHQERHLCQDETDASCRVTISANDGGAFTGVVRLSAEDANGENRVQPGSLLRVYGTIVQGEYDAQGGPLLTAQYYRHWPRGQYVTTAAAASWRR